MVNALEYRLSDFVRQKGTFKKKGEVQKVDEVLYRIAYYEEAAQALRNLEMHYDKKILQNALSAIFKETQKARDEVLRGQNSLVIEKVEVGIKNTHHIIVEEYERMKTQKDAENILFLSLIALDTIRDKICSLGQ